MSRMHSRRQKPPGSGGPSCAHHLTPLLSTNHTRTAVLVFAERSDAHLAPPTNNFTNSFCLPSPRPASILHPYTATSFLQQTTHTQRRKSHEYHHQESLEQRLQTHLPNSMLLQQLLPLT